MNNVGSLRSSAIIGVLSATLRPGTTTALHLALRVATPIVLGPSPTAIARGPAPQRLLGPSPAPIPPHPQHSPGTPTTGLRERGNDTSRSTGGSGRQNAATQRNMRRDERVTVQGPVKEQQPDGMSHGGRGFQRCIGTAVHRLLLRCGLCLAVCRSAFIICVPRQRWGLGQGCVGRKWAPEAVRQAVGGGCQSGWGRLLSATNAIEAGTWGSGGQWLGILRAPWSGGGVPPRCGPGGGGGK